MMAAVVGALPVACEMQSEAAMGLPEGVSLLLIRPDVSIEGLIAEGGEDQVDGGPSKEWERCGTYLLHRNFCNKILAEYHEFVAENPTWPEEHGAGGIQLMVLTPSNLLRGVVLSTPGEALSFDAWLQEIRGYPIRPIFGGVPDTTPPDTVEDSPSPDGDVTIDEPIAAEMPTVENIAQLSDDESERVDLPLPSAAPSLAGDPVASTANGGLSYRDAAWASLFSTSSAAEPTNATPAGGRRRGR